MDIILFFFVIPLAVIIFSVALQKLLRSPILVAAVIFAIALIIAFTVFGGSTTSIIAAIIYGILAFIVAWITSIVCSIIRRLCGNDCDRDFDNDNDDNDNNTGAVNLPNTRACRICRCQRNILRNFRR